MLFDKIEDVKLKNVTKRYGDFKAVDNVSLEVVGGELLILIGPSGSGKTTLLRTINRLVEPDEGEILINGKNVKEFDVVELRRSIGYVIQHPPLFYKRFDHRNHHFVLSYLEVIYFSHWGVKKTQSPL